MALLEIKNVDISYGKRLIVKNSNITLEKGEICSIVGESGSGKTTVIRAVLGLLAGGGKVTAGDIVYEGRSLLTLSDKEWRTNGKYDTCLYSFDITTGVCERLAKIPNRWIFSAIWADGDDNSDGCGLDIVPDEAGPAAIQNVTKAQDNTTEVFNISGQRMNGMQKGINIVKSGNRIQKVLNK